MLTFDALQHSTALYAVHVFRYMYAVHVFRYMYAVVELYSCCIEELFLRASYPASLGVN